MRRDRQTEIEIQHSGVQIAQAVPKEFVLLRVAARLPRFLCWLLLLESPVLLSTQNLRLLFVLQHRQPVHFGNDRLCKLERLRVRKKVGGSSEGGQRLKSGRCGNGGRGLRGSVA